MTFKIIENEKIKSLQSAEVNYDFNKNNGLMLTYGKTKEAKDDPQYSPHGNFILDIEVTTKCNGVSNLQGVKTTCGMCYKSNTTNGINMPFDTFKNIIDKMPKVLTQIAYGSDSEATSNPDLFRMMEYSRSIGIIPNITVAEITDQTADSLAKYCGAVAVSRYSNKDICYDTIKKLTDRGMLQVNMHFCVYKECLDDIHETLNDIKMDPRLSKLNAIVFLSLKKKGRGEKGFSTLNNEEFKGIVNRAMELGISWGSDSCGANKVLYAIKDRDNAKELESFIEPCESACFSFYIDVEGNGYPCSFAEGTDDWKEGLSVLNCNDFVKDIWNNERVVKFRNDIINCGRNCFLYEV